MDRIDEILKDLKKSAKRGIVSTGDDPHLHIDKLQFNIPLLDNILGGGLPYGRMIEFIGDFGAGKTYLSQKAIAEVQKKGEIAAYIDVEKCFDPKWFEISGVNLKKLIVVRPGTGEEALSLTVDLVESGVGIVVLDSVAALIPTAELEGEIEDSFMAGQARLFNKGLRKITQVNSKTIFLAINQVREGIGGPYVKESLPAGRGQQFFASIILKVMKGRLIEDGSDKKKIIGFKMRCRTDKNKLTQPFQECELPFIFEGGVIDVLAGLVELAIDCGIIKKRGPWYDLMDQHILGKLGVAEYLRNNEDVQEEIRKQITNA